MATSLMRGLEVFCALIEAGSATRASRQIGLSQPAVSQQIARLESELSLTLFIRENGRMRPTETALMLYEEASHAFDGLDRVINLAKDIRGLERGLLRVAAPYSSAATYLPRALRKLTSAHPRLRLIVHLGNYERIVGLVAAREVDLGIAKAPLLVPGVESVDICVSGLVAVTPADSPLARKKSLSTKDLAHEPLVMIGRGRPWRNEIDVAFRREGIAPRVSVETQSVESACGFAAEGFGTAIVPRWLADAVPRNDIAITPFKIGIEHRFLVVYPSRTKRAELAHDFADACRNALSGSGDAV
ncbi:LysR family transcriptional regulator [Oricola sp.]|uniref:LysR family transcriptional regulator n=1 Tax=Oricola sp. TaxID=1979950 RepID=UPI000C8B14C9|nr:LysR family transcriptional regulator [Ahrensia sp.]|tara:strand:- start:48741 stop:49646 length:906 start_codon:yes stop_codon:yes gene_type:complete